jgi:plastocyanin
MRARIAGVAALAAALAFPGAAFADATIQAVDGSAADSFNNRWSPAATTVKVGEQVSWSFEGTAAMHNVQSDSANWTLKTGYAVAGPAAIHTFTTPGTYTFLCELHKSTMTGSVTVTDATGAPPPPPPPPPLSEQPFANDTPPLSVLEVRDLVAPKLDRVRVARVKRGARVRFRLSEAGRVTIKLTRGPRTVKSRTIDAGKGSTAITVRGLRSGSYRVVLSARDLAGNAAKRPLRAGVTVRA